ncbi:signal peptidase I [Glycomyces sp. NRRL B-16210]|uniref:signal peptidase I n=1 Tax=Glycomyces sp. NRRL B-16210 TaxID=1463821 RepID=UPI00105DEDF0|nr:signal peptidase I [Glycomyces sp. NRRL B-16210]
MSPGPPGGSKGPRRIHWNRLPGPEGPVPPPPPDPRRSGPPGTGRPRGPVQGGPVQGGPVPGGRGAGPVPGGFAGPVAGGPTRPVRRVNRPDAPVDRVAAERERAEATFDRVNAPDHASGDRDTEPRRERTESESRLSHPHKRQYLSLWVELPLLLVVAFSAAVLLRTFAVQPFYIPSGSMEQTLQEGDKVLVLKLTTTLRSPQRGEVIVFRGTDSWDPEYRPAGGDGSFVSDFTTGVLDLIGLAEPDEKDFIKRIIAVGGDTVLCCDDDGNVVVNGVSLHEDYVYDDAPLDVEPGTCHARRFHEVEVPMGQVWAMGDHRGNSKDSRCQGPVPVENIIGRAIALVWPTDRATELEIPAVFATLEGTGADESSAAAEDGLPAAWGTYWHAPPSLPATAIPANGSQATARPVNSGAGARPRRLAP